MRDPLPLRDDESISDELRRDLAHVREVADPPLPFESGLERLKSSLAHRPPGARARAWKSWYAVLGCAVVLTGTMVAMRSSSYDTPPAPAVVSSHETTALPATPEAPKAPDTIAPDTITDRGMLPTQLPDAPPAEMSAKPSIVKAAPRASTASRSEQVHEELAHMRKLRAIVASDPSTSLRLAEEGQARFASGVFTQEREVISIEALQKLGRNGDAATRAARFLEAHPESPFADKVRQLAPR